VSQENVDVVRSFIVAFNAGDMEAVREMLDPDVAVGRELEGWPETDLSSVVTRLCAGGNGTANHGGILPRWSRSASSTPGTGWSRG
jgi:hypothetical protein